MKLGIPDEKMIQRKKSLKKKKDSKLDEENTDFLISLLFGI